MRFGGGHLQNILASACNIVNTYGTTVLDVRELPLGNEPIVMNLMIVGEMKVQQKGVIIPSSET